MNEILASANIQNASRDSERYIVARLDNGQLWYFGSWDDIDKAYDTAERLDNAIVLTRIGE